MINTYLLWVQFYKILIIYITVQKTLYIYITITFPESTESKRNLNIVHKSW